ncbi:MAG: DNA cytosine methyltransferase [Bacilli bacterium]|nr:DNA cytosine methyltransferase [Bacilli bacterium]
MRIRKISSREAWRLMGFTDEDYNKASKVCCETSLYHQAGNSIVVNVMYHLLKSIFA